MLTNFSAVMKIYLLLGKKAPTGEGNMYLILETNSPASGIICTQHTVLGVSKLDSKSLSFALVTLFQLPDVKIVQFRIRHRMRQDQTEKVAPQIWRDILFFFLLFFLSLYFSFKFSVISSTTALYFFSEYIGSFSSDRCCFVLANLKVNTGLVYSCKGKNCSNC